MKNKISWKICVAIAIILILLVIGFSYNSRRITFQGMKCLKHDINVEAQDDVYVIPNTSLKNGEMYLFQPAKGKGFNLNADERVSLSITIDTDFEDTCILGYYLDGEFVEVFSGRVADELNVGFTTNESGTYKIFMFGASADTTQITTGEVRIGK